MNTKTTYQLSFKNYVAMIEKEHVKSLTPNQKRFLIYPFITSIFWAKYHRHTIKKENITLFYNTIFKQLSINF